MSKISYSRHRFPPAVTHRSVWLYFRFPLSFRDVEEMLAERGIDVSYEAIRRWIFKFGPAIAANVRSRGVQASGTWHLDEFFVRIGGKRTYLWRAVDGNSLFTPKISLLSKNISLLRFLGNSSVKHCKHCLNSGQFRGFRLNTHIFPVNSLLSGNFEPRLVRSGLGTQPRSLPKTATTH